MIKNAMYFGKRDLYNLIKRVGGEWNDTKDRPIFCCIESLEHKGLYWAIPVGNYNHRDASANIGTLLLKEELIILLICHQRI